MSHLPTHPDNPIELDCSRLAYQRQKTYLARSEARHALLCSLLFFQSFSTAKVGQ